MFIYVAYNHRHHMSFRLMHQCIITYTNASYRIAGENISIGTREAGWGRLIGNPGTGGARGRGARRRSARVHGPST
jgi:hypothetical protein